jgi:hypothetical protein
MNSNTTPTTYAVASGLIGFRSSTLRVIVTRREGSYVWVRTADLLDAGTALVLDASQVKNEEPETVLYHREGLVAL